MPPVLVSIRLEGYGQPFTFS